MQIKVTFRVLYPGQLLPMSYQYELSSFLYRQMQKTDADFARFLHHHGYGEGRKKFKLFTFSNLHFPPPFKILDDRIRILSEEISFVCSFLVPQAATDMVLGLFQEQTFRLGDTLSQVDLQTQVIQALPLPGFLSEGNPDTRQTVHFKATAPIMVSRPEMRAGGKLYHQYLAPDDADYAHYLFQNLEEKYLAAAAHRWVQPLRETPAPHFENLSAAPKRRLIRIRAHSPGETRVAGYLFEGRLTVPREWLRVALLAGLGGENALGFGAIRVLG